MARGVDAVIVNYNGRNDLVRLLSDQRLKDSFDRVIVVDNESVDGSADVVRRADVELIRSPSNVGFGAAANLGLRASEAKVVAVLNPDIRIDDRSAIPSLMRHFEDRRTGVVAPALRLPDGTIQDSARTVPSPFTIALRRFANPRRGAITSQGPTVVPWVVAAFVMLDRAAALEVGGFDPRFFLYFEDVDLCVRMSLRGKRVIFDPTVVLRHEHRGASRDSLSSRAARTHTRSALLFWRTHPRYVIPEALRAPRRDPNRLLALAWGAHTDRAAQMAEALDGEARCLGNLGLKGRTSAPVRWAVNALRTVAILGRRRPRVVIVQNPPIFPGLIAAAYCSLTDAVLLLDSHPASFGRKRAHEWKLMVPLHRFVARRSRAVLVTESELRNEVAQWGAQALIVHEPPRTMHPDDRARHDVERVAGVRRGTGVQSALVTMVAVFAPDEPVLAALQAAALVPEIDLHVTGNPERARPGDLSAAGANVTFTGFLHGREYVEQLRRSDAILALSTERTSVMRCAYEAVYAHKPLIVSDWPIARETFPYALFTANDPESIAAALQACVASLPELRELSDRAAVEQRARWTQQLADVNDVLRGR